MRRAAPWLQSAVGVAVLVVGLLALAPGVRAQGFPTLPPIDPQAAPSPSPEANLSQAADPALPVLPLPVEVPVPAVGLPPSPQAQPGVRNVAAPDVPRAAAVASAGWLVVLASQFGGSLDALRDGLSRARTPMMPSGAAPGDGLRLRAAGRAARGAVLAAAVAAQLAQHPGADERTLARAVGDTPRHLRRALRGLARAGRVLARKEAGSVRYYPVRP